MLVERKMNLPATGVNALAITALADCASSPPLREYKCESCGYCDDKACEPHDFTAESQHVYGPQMTRLLTTTIHGDAHGAAMFYGRQGSVCDVDNTWIYHGHSIPNPEDKPVSLLHENVQSDILTAVNNQQDSADGSNQSGKQQQQQRQQQEKHFTEQFLLLGGSGRQKNDHYSIYSGRTNVIGAEMDYVKQKVKTHYYSLVPPVPITVCQMIGITDRHIDNIQRSLQPPNFRNAETTTNKEIKYVSGNTIVGNAVQTHVSQSIIETGGHMDRRAVKCKDIRPSRPPLLPPCRVCSAKASGYHYGVNTCEACKGFFRRSTCKKEPYVCIANGDCVIKSGKRTTCSSCRQKKCIVVGMSKFAIKTGRYTHELRTKNILEVKRLEIASLHEHYLANSVAPPTQLDPYSVAPPTLADRRVLLALQDAESAEMEIILKSMMKGQYCLHEFLDDYYNDEVILQRQFDVYKRYISEKIKTSQRPRTKERQSHSDIFLDKLVPDHPEVNSGHFPSLVHTPEWRQSLVNCSHVAQCREAGQRGTGVLAVPRYQPRVTPTEPMAGVMTGHIDYSHTDSCMTDKPSSPIDYKVSSMGTWPSNGSTTYNSTMTGRVQNHTSTYRDHEIHPPTEPTSHNAHGSSCAETLPQVDNESSSLYNHIKSKTSTSHKISAAGAGDEPECVAETMRLSTTFKDLIDSSLPKDRQFKILSNGKLSIDPTSAYNDATKADNDDPEHIDLDTGRAISEHKKIFVINHVISDMERGIQGLVLFSKSVPGFTDLPHDDQAELLKVSRFDIWYIGHIRCFNIKLQVGACEWRFHGEELEHVWGRTLVDMLWKLTRLGQKLKLTKEETACLRGLSITFPDRCQTPLKARTEVEEIHEKVYRCFKYVASQKTRRHFNVWFAQVVDFLIYLREFGIEFDKHSNHLQLEWLVIQKNPLLLEVFFS